jgi:predicted DNA-binding protein (UPF0251 family)
VNPITVYYKLKLKGYTLSKLAKEVGVSKQVVWEAIYNNRKGIKSLQVWKRIDKLIQ